MVPARILRGKTFSLSGQKNVVETPHLYSRLVDPHHRRWSYRTRDVLRVVRFFATGIDGEHGRSGGKHGGSARCRRKGHARRADSACGGCSSST
jgi:hypothetical protein